MHKYVSVAVSILLSMGAVLGACGDVSGGGSWTSSLSSIDASGAVMGQQGRLRVSLTNPANKSTDIMLTSSNPAIATIPDHVTVPYGAASADVMFTGVSSGTVV